MEMNRFDGEDDRLVEVETQIFGVTVRRRRETAEDTARRIGRWVFIGSVLQALRVRRSKRRDDK